MHRKKSVLELQTRHRGICLQSIMENSGISQKLKCKYGMQQHVNNNVAKNRVFQSQFLHMGGCPLNIGDNFSLLSQSIFVFVENTLFIHAAQKCVSRRKNLKIVSGRQQKKQEGHQDMTSSSLSHS